MCRNCIYLHVIPSALRKMKRQSTQINETENTLLKSVRSVRKVSVYYSHSPTCNGVKNVVTGRKRSVFTGCYPKFSIYTVLAIYSVLNFLIFILIFNVYFLSKSQSLRYRKVAITSRPRIEDALEL